MSGEARQNLLALAIVCGVVALAIGFAVRPGVLLPATKTALANSVAGELGGFSSETRSSECVAAEEEDGVYECHASVHSYSGPGFNEVSQSGGTFRVSVDWSGCWREIAPGRRPLDGCISILDY